MVKWSDRLNGCKRSFITMGCSTDPESILDSLPNLVSLMVNWSRTLPGCSDTFYDFLLNSLDWKNFIEQFTTTSTQTVPTKCVYACKCWLNYFLPFGVSFQLDGNSFCTRTPGHQRAKERPQPEQYRSFLKVPSSSDRQTWRLSVRHLDR